MPGIIPRPFNIASQGQPTVGADIIDALVWESTAFGGTTDILSGTATARAGGLLWIPATTPISVLVYGIQMCADTNTTVRLGLVSAQTGYTTPGFVQPKHLQSTGFARVAAQAQVFSSIAAPTITGANNFFKAQMLAASQTFQFFGGFANVVLRPGNGLVIVADGPAGAWKFSAMMDWVEYAVT